MYSKALLDGGESAMLYGTPPVPFISQHSGCAAHCGSPVCTAPRAPCAQPPVVFGWRYWCNFGGEYEGCYYNVAHRRDEGTFWSENPNWLADIFAPRFGTCEGEFPALAENCQGGSGWYYPPADDGGYSCGIYIPQCDRN